MVAVRKQCSLIIICTIGKQEAVSSLPGLGICIFTEVRLFSDSHRLWFPAYSWIPGFSCLFCGRSQAQRGQHARDTIVIDNHNTLTWPFVFSSGREQWCSRNMTQACHGGPDLRTLCAPKYCERIFSALYSSWYVSSESGCASFSHLTPDI